MKKILLLLVGLYSYCVGFSQQNFTISNAKPQAGETLTISYKKAGKLLGNPATPMCYALLFENKNKTIEPRIVDINLTAQDDVYNGNFFIDSNVLLVAFAFKINEEFDTNNNDGYIYNIYSKSKPKPNSYGYLGYFKASYWVEYLGLEIDYKKANAAVEKEFELYPESKRSPYFNLYYFVMSKQDKAKAQNEAMNLIEYKVKQGLSTREHYEEVAGLHSILGNSSQAEFYTNIAKQKFPSIYDNIDVRKRYQWFVKEKSNAARQQLIDSVQQIIAQDKVETNASKQQYERYLKYYEDILFKAYVKDKNWEFAQKMLSTTKEKDVLASRQNTLAWQMQNDSFNLPLAQTLSQQALEYAKTNMQKVNNQDKPAMSTLQEWVDTKKSKYAECCNTYSMILFKTKQYKKALPYITEACDLLKWNDKEVNGSYALIAEQVTKTKVLKPKLEQLIVDAKANEKVYQVIKSIYTKENGNDNGYDNYITALEKQREAVLKSKLMKEVINTPAPNFSLKDLNGNNTVKLSDLKGKIVVLDFWATWCGPCVASMPSMNKVAASYKDNPNVVFLFVNCWQTENNKQEVVVKFMKEKGYPFTVLMDNENTVVTDYKVSGIPTKFVIGKDGNIKFKSVGFEGDIELPQHLNAMISMCE